MILSFKISRASRFKDSETFQTFPNLLNISILQLNSDGRDEAEEPEAGGEDVAGHAGQGGHWAGEGGAGRVHQDIGVQQRPGRYSL